MYGINYLLIVCRLVVLIIMFMNGTYPISTSQRSCLDGSLVKSYYIPLCRVPTEI